MSDPFFALTGIHLQDLISGFAGGLARALMPPFVGPWESMSSVLLGVLTAAYMTDTAAALIAAVPGMDKLNRGAVGFIVGITAMSICQGIIGAVKKAKFLKAGGHKDAA